MSISTEMPAVVCASKQHVCDMYSVYNALFLMAKPFNTGIYVNRHMGLKNPSAYLTSFDSLEYVLEP